MDFASIYDEHARKREWLVIEDTRSYGVFGDRSKRIMGYIPRDVMEARWGKIRGSTWFNLEQHEWMHNHPEWRTDFDGEKPEGIPSP